ncbi:glycosyltransferase involved in cell wall biosynthesis [Pedobacter sp. CAN_A7]|uniref:glycosyltransferase n=1 Tax=Pedobacter sp. CAN_A7 TaxID=2787722 RepID=UPI0018CBB1C4
MDYHFKDVSLLITHYNRSESLENLLIAFKSLNCFFQEIVISDDGSADLHLNRIKELKQAFDFKLVTSAQNQGLGNNLNKGQAAVTCGLTLYIQEDFIPTAKFPEEFQKALAIFNEQQDLDIIRFYAYVKYPYLENYKDGYSLMYIKPWHADYQKIYYYSDHPHLRRSNFNKKFGKYAEGIKGDRTEYQMCVSFIQKKGKGLFYNDYQSLFVQKNSEAEPSTMTRTNLTQSRNPFITALRYVYRQLKYNYDINFYKAHH